MDRKTLLGLITGACMLGLVLFFGGMLVGAGLFMGPDAPQNTSSIADDGDMEVLAQNKAPRVQTEIAPRQNETLTPDADTPNNTDSSSTGDNIPSSDASGVDAAQGNDPVGDLIAEKTGEEDGVKAGTSDPVTAPDAPAAPEIRDMPQTTGQADTSGVDSGEKSQADEDTASVTPEAPKPEAPAIRKESKPPKPVSTSESTARTGTKDTSEIASSAALHREPGSKNMPYSIQVGAFKVDTNARQRAGELRKKGLEVAVVERANNGATWYYVRVGAYEDAASARSGAEKVKKDTGIDGFPVRAEPNDKKID
ncbi:hypothetical protein TH25_24745 [Thalassospira profundimaris]|uniref:SPOR domain-containing protein n=1 Tax=Thalassospira profundimaris TaxID=502049 RepID=A0A367WIY7_9PROT|nr:SPOR domain-containing protein [Thalassospira profundimaris]RCK40521.1 hypothetical protein TH25_24745 [Thalassospira profundimaris]